MKKFLLSRLGLFSVTTVAYGLMFGAILVLEVLTSPEPLSAARLAIEAVEFSLLTSGIIGVTYLIRKLERQAKERAALLSKLQDVRAESEEWRAKAHTHVLGLVNAISLQCDQWGLTPAEKDVAFLMLKGLSHKEIAILRDTHESTVRQQARSIYGKAGLNSRRAFCAYFLDDLLPSAEDQSRLADNVHLLTAHRS